MPLLCLKAQKSDSWHGELDFMPFISYLIENDHLTDDTQIAEIEFGNEIWSVHGKKDRHGLHVFQG